MKPPPRRPAVKKTKPAANSGKRKIRAELYHPANIEKARRLDYVTRAC
ncbi:MAG: hypothetical protein LBK60_10215 [Verrucomicrobiales bacterium]|jgi:hypothetical protein|nr:hypothetical protein [Verrucomicrobiales bacterium]